MVHIELWYHMYGSDMGMLTIEAAAGTSAASATGWSAEWSVSGEQQSSHSAAWQRVEIGFTPLVDSVARIRGHTGSDYHSDIAILNGVIIWVN